MKVSYKKLCPEAKVPTYGTEYSAGADLCTLDALEIAPGATVLVHTGIAMEIPEGYCGLVFARSGLATKRGLAPANKVGVIDADYRGEIMIPLHNHTDVTATVEAGERVAQIALIPFLKAELVECNELSDTVRGLSGFGSTGTK